MSNPKETLMDALDMVVYDATNPSFITQIRRGPYDAIAPTQPQLSAAGKTVLVTGGATGIGFSIAKHFAAAGATTVILFARRPQSLADAAAAIAKEHPNTQILTYSVDVSNLQAITKGLQAASNSAKSKTIDIVVTSAAFFPTASATLDVPTSEIQSVIQTNVIGHFHLVREFIALPSHTGHQKTVIDVSSNGALHPYPTTAFYGGTKGMFTWLMRHVQSEHPEVRIHSLHPGAIYTPAMEAYGIPREAIAAIEDHVDLPGSFTVWLASPEAEFLKGRFVFARWDKEELVKAKGLIEKDSSLLNMKFFS